MAELTVLTDRVAAVRRRIEAAGGDPDRVRIIAVTKTFGADAVAAAKDAGLLDVGENYAQELVAKAAEVSGMRWHFIGRLQRNKVRELAPIVHLWQSVDRPALVAELAKRCPGASVLIQVNLSGEGQKGGCDWGDAEPLVTQARSAGLDVQGLMGVGPNGPPESARPGFRRLAELAGELGLPELSMGMTADLDIAVQEGSTMVRIGTALFGPRSGPADAAR